MMHDLNFSFFESLANEVPVGILVLDQEGQCIYANKFSLNLFECPLEFDPKNLAISKLIPNRPPDRRMKMLNLEILKHEGHYHEILISKFTSQIFTASLSIKFLTQNNHLVRILLVQDITAQKKLQREVLEKQSMIAQAYEDLLAQNKQLKELDIAKNRFLAVVTHELRTPLSAMVASADLLRTGLYDSQEQFNEFIGMIHEQGQHLTNLINDILDFAKIQSNKLDYYVQLESLNDLVKDEASHLEAVATSSGIKLSFESNQNNTHCYFDSLRIKQVISNLIINAIKYNRRDGNVEVSLSENKNFVIVHIKDSGPGIAYEDQRKIFDEFETLGKIALHSKGTGLGLPISLRMMNAMGGDILVESEKGKGSIFHLRVPKEKILSPENYRKRVDDLTDGDLAA